MPLLRRSMYATQDENREGNRCGSAADSNRVAAPAVDRPDDTRDVADVVRSFKVATVEHTFWAQYLSKPARPMAAYRCRHACE